VEEEFEEEIVDEFDNEIVDSPTEVERVNPVSGIKYKTKTSGIIPKTVDKAKLIVRTPIEKVIPANKNQKGTVVIKEEGEVIEVEERTEKDIEKQDGTSDFQQAFDIARASGNVVDKAKDQAPIYLTKDIAFPRAKVPVEDFLNAKKVKDKPNMVQTTNSSKQVQQVQQQTQTISKQGGSPDVETEPQNRLVAIKMPERFAVVDAVTKQTMYEADTVDNLNTILLVELHNKIEKVLESL
jgi:DNA-binding protein YbaB